MHGWRNLDLMEGKAAVSDDLIDPKELRFVVRALHNVCKNWRAIGDQLDIDNLDIIRQNYSTVTQCLIAMVDSLLRGRFNSRPGSPASWQTIVRVVGDPAGGDSYQHATLLAAKLNEFRSFTPSPLAQTVSREALVGEFASKADLSAVVARLVQLLQPIAARWFEVGALLGLPLGESLTSIRHDPSLGSDTARLRRVLEEWLLHAERWGLEVPSWQVLVDVLAHGTGGDDPGLAQTLAQHSLCADGTVTIKIRSPFCDLVSSSAHDEYASNTHSTVTPPQSTLQHTLSATFLSPACSEYASFLCQTYLDDTITSHQKWPPVAVKKYINLASITKGAEECNKHELDDFTKAAIFRGDIDAIVCKKEPFQLEQLAKLPDGSKPKLVLVEGAPGAGKSTFAWKFCRQWGKHKLLGEYPLLVLLRLREQAMQDASSIADLFFHPDPEIQKGTVSHLQRSQGKGLLLVLEGLDEAAPSLQNEGSLLMNIISGRLLPKATILVTSRPSATAVIHRTCASRISQHIEVLGFTKEDINSYIQAAMPESLHANIDQYLEHYPHINAMMYNPLNCAIVVEVFKTKQLSCTSLASTITELFKCLIIDLLLRYLYAQYKGREWSLDGFQDLPPNVYAQLVEIGRIAYVGSCKGQSTFVFSPGQLETLGLMQNVPNLYQGRGIKYSCSFLHSTVQEFMTAFYISQLEIKVQILIFREKYKDPKWQTILRFIAGLTRLSFLFSVQSASQRLKIFLNMKRNSPQSLRSVDLRTILHWVYEAQNGDILNFFLENTSQIKMKFESSISLTPFDCFEIGFCVSQYKVTSLKMKNCGINKDKAIMLARGMKAKPTANLHFKTLSLSGGWNKSSGNEIGEGGAADILHEISSFDSLATLNLHNTCIGLEDCQALSEIFSAGSNLVKLDIAVNSLSSEALHLVLTAIERNAANRLQILNLSWNYLQNSAALSSLLTENQTITKLEIGWCKMGVDGACQIAAALKHNITLRYLGMNGNDIQQEGACTLAEALKLNQGLAHLSLYDTTIACEGTTQIVQNSRYGLKLLLFRCETTLPWHKRLNPNITWETNELTSAPYDW